MWFYSFHELNSNHTVMTPHTSLYLRSCLCSNSHMSFCICGVFFLNPAICKHDNISLSGEIYSKNKILVFSLMELETAGWDRAVGSHWPVSFNCCSLWMLGSRSGPMSCGPREKHEGSDSGQPACSLACGACAGINQLNLADVFLDSRVRGSS